MQQAATLNNTSLQLTQLLQSTLTLADITLTQLQTSLVNNTTNLLNSAAASTLANVTNLLSQLQQTTLDSASSGLQVGSPSSLLILNVSTSFPLPRKPGDRYVQQCVTSVGCNTVLLHGWIASLECPVEIKETLFLAM